MLIDSKRPFYLISSLIVLIFLGVVIFQKYQNKIGKNAVTIFTGVGAVKINIEYAETQKELSRGLMNRDSLPRNSGMFFVFPDEKNRVFWMKNVLIPLDLIFISANGRVNEIVTLPPCPQNTESCPEYKSKYPAQYVIEVNSGFSQKNRMVEGDILEIPEF